MRSIAMGLCSESVTLFKSEIFYTEKNAATFSRAIAGNFKRDGAERLNGEAAAAMIGTK